MFSINNFKDEKFRDTIKKNYCRLRQKSLSRLGEHSSSQAQNEYTNKIQNEEKNNEINKKINPKNYINSKYKNYKQSKIYIKRPIKEEKNNMIQKNNEDNNNYTIPLKQRILMKLKEERNEKLKNSINYDEKNFINNNNFYNKDSNFKNFAPTHKRYIGSVDINNVIYRNKNKNNTALENKNLSKTINNEVNQNMKSIKFNFEKNIIINRNHKNMSSQGNKTIFDSKNCDLKFNNFHKKTIVLTKNKTDLIDEKNELTNFSKSYLTNQLNKFNFVNDEFSENLQINKRKNKNHVNNNINDMFFEHNRESYFNNRKNFNIEKEEEEKNKCMNEENTDKNIIVNKTLRKPMKTLSFFDNNFVSNKISHNNINNKLRNNNSLKLSPTKSRKNLANHYELNIKNLFINKNEINANNLKNKKAIYLETEKPKLFSKSILFKNLMINTDYNYKNRNNHKMIDKNINKIKNISENDDFKDDNQKNTNKIKKINISSINNINIYNSPNLTKRNDKIFFNELLSPDKDKQYQNVKEASTIKKELCNIDYLIKMLIEAIQLKNSIEIYSLFSILLINFNNKYIVLYDQKIFLKEVLPFLDCYKYLSIIIIPLIFFYKDENIYKINCSDVKKILENLIFICLEKFGQKAYKYKKVVSFMEEHKKTDRKIIEYDSMEECCLEIVNIIFKNYKEYAPLRKVIEQLIDLSFKESLENLINIINNTILYCFNHKQKNNFYLLNQLNGTFTYKKNKSPNKDLNNTITIPSVPYIKTSMKKNFCLVLDIDETIVHTINLPFGNYFLLRPGVINFLEEISKLYEIIIFTSSPKTYADSILNKIDEDNKFISHRLYKEHVIFEKGKSVKKLNLIGRDLNKIIFVDNMKCNAKYNLKNLYLIPSWIYDINDQELIKLKSKLKYIATDNKFKDDITKGLESVK